MQEDALFPQWNRTKSEASNVFSYGAVCWAIDAKPEAGEATIVVAAAMPSRAGGFVRGSHRAIVRGRIGGFSANSPMPSVDEAIGVVHPKPTPEQEDWGLHCETVIADYLMFVTHRMLFGTSGDVWPELDGADEVGTLLVFGPALPKYRGRICYSHFRNDKTVAIVAPARQLGRPPRLARGPWEIHPTPAFWHDCASRTWHQRTPADSADSRIADFEIVVPTGDGMGAPVSAPVPSTIWDQKSRQIQSILDCDRTAARLQLWNNEEVYLPKGLAKAALEATLHLRIHEGIHRRNALVERFGFDKITVQKIEKQLRPHVADADVTSRQAEKFMAHVFCEAVEAWERQRSAKSVPSLERREKWPDQIVGKAHEVRDLLHKQIGAFLFS